ncbi:MAG TPA: dienelactone hydrolase family protein [Burkholderiales bacterium]|jgi:dienelactone hydrolase|nr:dienelactone hydrolase family protein [Burkholderiales bacterium]
MHKIIIGAALALSLASRAQAAIHEEPVTYKDGDTVLKGFVVYDDAKKGKRPGIVVVHEWWGITKHTRDEARRFARQGYTAFVADMYGEAKTADNPTDASGLMKSVMGDPALVRSRFNAAFDELAKNPRTDAKKIGASGYCMGGAVVLSAARAGADLAGVAAFHPSLGGYRTAEAPMKAKVLVLNGAEDKFNKPEQIDSFKKDMGAAKADLKFIDYPGAVHAFTNPEATEKGKKYNIPLAYDAKADKASKAEADKFFRAVFK